jgi:hypothetical protein
MEEVKDGRMTSAFMIMGLADITQGVVDWKAAKGWSGPVLSYRKKNLLMETENPDWDR